MSSHFQVVADVEATAGEAASLAAAVTGWLVDSGILVAGRPAGARWADLDFAPGPRHGAAIEHPDSDSGIRPAGVEVIIGRTVFHSMGADRVTCPHCRHVIALTNAAGEPNEAWWHLVDDAIEPWHAGGRGRRACPACGREVGLNDWTWSPPWAFAHLGFTFWNWPPLDPRFLAEMSRLLGHRTVHPYGKV